MSLQRGTLSRTDAALCSHDLILSPLLCVICCDHIVFRAIILPIHFPFPHPSTNTLTIYSSTLNFYEFYELRFKLNYQRQKRRIFIYYNACGFTHYRCLCSYFNCFPFLGVPLSFRHFPKHVIPIYLFKVVLFSSLL